MKTVQSATMPRRLPPGCVEDRDRHGNIRVYYRAEGRPKVRLRSTPWTQQFMEEYEQAKGQPAPTARKGITPGTWRWLCVKYFSECADYKQLDPRTQHVRRLILESTFDEPIKPGASKSFRDFPLSKMTSNAIEVLRDRKLDYPEAANSRLKANRGVFRWAARKKAPDGKPLVFHNPVRDIPYLKSKNPSGYHSWIEDEIRRYRERHPFGTKAYLALDLFFYLGQRRSDIIRLGWQHVSRDGKKITFTQFKGRNRKPTKLVLPILPVLKRTLDASPCGDMTFLVNEQGRPFTDAGFGNWFRDRCREAGVPGRAHGLRKAGAVKAAENGATANQLMAIFGWRTIGMAERYTRAANQERLSEAAMHLLESSEQTRTESSPTGGPSGTFSEKNPEKSKTKFVGGARGGNRTPTPCGTRF
jgi:integrase